MNVLSLFDGKSSGYTALEIAGLTVDNYYSSEIDKYAIQVSDAIHPNQTRLGDILGWHFWRIDWSSIDLVLGGFPCQAWSMAGKQKGDKDERGKLFWYMLDVMAYVLHYNKKAKFLIENVKMKKEFEEYITYHTEQALGTVEKHLINSALVSAQNRNRYYWTNIKGVTQPDDRGVLLADIVESGIVDQDKSYCIDANYWKGGNLKSYFEKHRRQLVFLAQRPRGNNPGGVRAADGKTPCLSSNSWEHNNHLTDGVKYRKLTPRECFRLQTTPEHYIDKILDCGVSNTQLYKIAGNGWTDEVIAHIFKGLT